MVCMPIIQTEAGFKSSLALSQNTGGIIVSEMYRLVIVP